MALKRRNEIRQFENVSEIELSPASNEAWRIHDIQISKPSSETFMEVNIGGTTVGYFPIFDGKYEFFSVPQVNKNTVNFLETLRKAGINILYPVSESDKFVLKFTNSIEKLKLIYDVYDAGDVKPTEPNGSKSDVLTYMAIVTNSEDITDEHYHTLDKLLNPTEMPDFPADIVPSGYKIQIHSIGFKDYKEEVDSSNYAYTKYLRIWFRRQVLYDPDKNGFLVEEGFNSLVPVEVNKNFPQFFGNDLIFIEGDEVNFQVMAKIVGSGKISAEALRLYLLCTLSPSR